MTGTRRYSSDLPQGGLEIPCTLTFTGKEKDLSKVKSLLSRAPSIVTSVSPDHLPLPSKRIKLEPVEEESEVSISAKIWLRAHGCYMTELDKDILLHGGLLNDRHIDFAQRLLSRQFPSVGGLVSTLYQMKVPAKKIKQGVQIIHDRGNHWILASSVCHTDVVKIYDSIYSNVDGKTKDVVVNLFHAQNLEVVGTQKQAGGEECGLFAIATATAILFAVSVIEIDLFRV